MKEEFAVLKRLGPVPFWRGENRCIPELETIYAKARDRAVRRLAAENAGKESKPK